jgi:FkbM family methyltransferase
MVNLAFDIGANIGLWTEANLNKFDKIISIEASPITFEKLKQCKNSNENLVNYAICDNNGKDIKFYHADREALSTLNKDWLTDSKSRFFNDKYKEIICKTKTIDDLIKEYGKPHLLKIDVEGGEYECIKSLTQKVDCLCFEWVAEMNDITYKCLEYLSVLGFTKFYIQMGDNYTFFPKTNVFEDLSLVKEKLSKMIEKKDWGMIWCI